MDPELLRQRAEFKSRAANLPTVQQRPSAKPDPDDDPEERRGPPKPKKSKSGSSGSGAATEMALKVTASSSANFGTLVKVVDLLKKRHLEKIVGPLTLDEVLEELTIFDLDARTRKWLMEALPANKRVAQPDPGRFEYRPPYPIKGKNGLLKVLRKADIEGTGGILLSELADCVANPDKVVQELADSVLSIPTQVNKKKDRVLFFNDPDVGGPVDQEFKERWRMVSVEHMDEKKIDEYLAKHGIQSMQDLAPKRGGAGPKRKAARRGRKGVVHNEHLEKNLLKDYTLS